MLIPTAHTLAVILCARLQLVLCLSCALPSIIYARKPCLTLHNQYVQRQL